MGAIYGRERLLLENWKKAWKLKSVQVGAISAFFDVLILFAEQFLGVWNIIPQDLKDLIPEQWQEYVGIFVGVGIVLARLKKQPELHSDIQPFVTVTAGHSNKDPGAVNGKFKEAELVSQFRNAVAYYLREAGIQYKTDGVGTLNQDLNSAIKLIKGSSVAVEFHMNAAASKQANGVETIALPKDKKLAQALSKAVADAFGSRLRGDKGWIDQSQSARGKLGFISNGGLIVELGFISNEAELAQFNTRYWVAAKAVAHVFIDYEKRN
ncbi:N-acetylmuramoyl-L-alanine amidase [Acinetobacter albensis]|uniref:N-acetylmuramoyl-L-alanine amidase n=1 Tax=Acinetobacter albensis TaxID=1673609 RepID=A0A1C4GXT1_9GAMM|nr:N-acetylmuramoyl-L-alanine amidase [Acinetobacter albensis]SCC72745.1 N-acetylmuramoyl-L-alanine amidase [Acinetobacter albensis]